MHKHNNRTALLFLTSAMRREPSQIAFAICQSTVHILLSPCVLHVHYVESNPPKHAKAFILFLFVFHETQSIITEND